MGLGFSDVQGLGFRAYPRLSLSLRSQVTWRGDEGLSIGLCGLAVWV